MRKTDAFRRAAALMAALSITVSLAAPAFAGTYYIDDGDITITKDEHGKQTVQQGSNAAENIGDDEEIIITTHKKAITTQESDLEGPAAEDTGFGPVVEDNYQPAQPEDAEEPEGTDQPESTEEPKAADRKESAEEPEGTDQPENTDRQEDADQPKDTDQPESAGQQAQPQQAAPAAAPAAPTSVNPKDNGFWGNTITVINKAATALKLTLKDVKIDVSDTGSDETYGLGGIQGKAALSVQGNGNVEIELDGKNELKSGYSRAGLEKNTSTSTGTLTLKDDNKEAGSLTATGGYVGAGIGGQGKKEVDHSLPVIQELYGASNITITGGTVTAAGGDYGAGIGGGRYGSGKNITITGGRVTAATTNFGAGIGGGDCGNGENITITGGTVNATGGQDGAGIGGGNGENIKITGGTVTARGGEASAGIGGGNGGSGKNITITGGTVTAEGLDWGAGIGGGEEGSGEDITITGGTVTATGGVLGAGIGGGAEGSGQNIKITGGTVNASGWAGAGIGGGVNASGINVTVSGAAQVTATAAVSKDPGWHHHTVTGATIGDGCSVTDDEFVDGEEIQADISGLTTGYIHHIIYNEDGSVKQEWWEYGHLQPAPDTPNAPAEESNGVSLGTPVLHVETLEGDPLPFDARQQGSTLRVTSDNLAARLHGTRQALEALQEQGVEQIQFVTTLKTTTLSVSELLAEGGSWFALEHNGLVSRRLSAAQAESLKCRMR
ncbi:hypothetical protein [Faecalibacterium prausnitzii]|uniref:hypothetical protein n=1 Tax=Faecalibacterium prausnitzii TaxID=853 RepID=UPI0029103C74|nr:hypothetical protein [Faecalibacterium prausnitzii]MDU8667948.1 hypothetical protein [Faecalibacterium prausnitzii]